MSESSESQHPIIRIGLAGLGNVGAGVVKNLIKNGELFSERTRAQFEITRVAVRDLEKPRDVQLSPEVLTTNWRDLTSDPQIQVIIELIGGVQEAFELVCAALRAKKVVITGNKALLAERGKELFALADQMDVPIYFEAAVAGGIPIIKTIQETFVGNHIRAIYGILNGTSNYILSRMSQAGLTYLEGLKEAQTLGYAEPDPTLDVNGWDAAHKAIILASLSYGRWIRMDDIHVEGIDGLELQDIRYAHDLGYEIKLLCVIHAEENGGIEVRTQPSLIRRDHVLASVNGVFNAVLVHGDIVGESLFYGQGAGQDPTSSSVLSDLADAVVAVRENSWRSGFEPMGLYGETRPIEDTVSRYYVRIRVEDKPGVLSRVTGVLGEHGVSVQSVNQPTGQEPGSTNLIMLLHRAPLGKCLSAVEDLTKLECVITSPVWLRVEDLDL